jgi:beta-N-acetylhexosaminidase
VPFPGRRRARAGLAVLVVAALAGGAVVVVLVSGGATNAPPQAASRLGGQSPAASRVGLLDALATVLAEPAKGGPAVPSSIRDLAARLPIKRQVAQLFAVGFEGQQPRAPFFEGLRGRDWGAVVLTADNYTGDPSQLAALAGEVRVVARDAGHVPPLVGAAQIGGEASAFANLPPRAPVDVAATLTPPRAQGLARLAGAQLRLLGVTMTLAPVADVASAASPLAAQSFGEDPALVARYVRAAVDGYRQARIVSAVGHFPGQGAGSADPDEAVSTVGLSLSDLRARDLRPFAAVIRAAPVVLVSNAVYAAYDGVTPATLLPDVTTGLLRSTLGFRGVAMTDDLEAATQASGISIGEAAVQALRAGADLLYVSGPASDEEAAYRAVLAAVRSGRVKRPRIEGSVLRLLELKRTYGLIRPASAGAGASAGP